MSLYSTSTDQRSSLRRSMSVPHLNSVSTTTSRADSAATGYSGSCSDLDQMGHQYHDDDMHTNRRHRRRRHHRQEAKNATRLVTDLRQLMTLRQHYYPEGGWGWLITVIGVIMQLISHGLHMSVGVFIVEIMKTYRVSSIRAGEWLVKVLFLWIQVGFFSTYFWLILFKDNLNSAYWFKLKIGIYSWCVYYRDVTQFLFLFPEFHHSGHPII